MVITTNGLNLINGEILDSFDIMTHMGFGTGTNTPSITDTTLQTETLRYPFNIDSVKDIGNGTYEFQGRIPLPDGNSDTFAELGIFSASSGGTMGFRELFSSTFTKTDSDEIIITVQLTVTEVNL